ncbi:hypothetical protein [Campylobacter sp. CNRCH_2014_2452]|uniref:hypothetical protein n=1 Tax=Campylobacter sp. CNRCH_2014_2452 TaxID=2911603 RepID=UPI00185F08A3|nr:hypothetical protein [Campylobacter sp. CNRCH_2014_2452]EAJ6150333.1 hypothetical protein [Campylobacter lari]MCV3486125.1 hypothetical protein [Campylobacter sp. CNRCH_2014_2452]
MKKENIDLHTSEYIYDFSSYLETVIDKSNYDFSNKVEKFRFYLDCKIELYKLRKSDYEKYNHIPIFASEVFNDFMELELLKYNGDNLDKKLKIMSLYRCGWQTINAISSHPHYDIKMTEDIKNLFDYLIDLNYFDFLYQLFDKENIEKYLKLYKQRIEE